MALLHHISLSELALRLLAALLLGGAIGWEREWRHKPAGLRTHMLVSLGAAAFMLLGFELIDQVAPNYERARIDPIHVIEGVVGGIGFLGAGCIIQSQNRVQGITTAAGVWVAGGVGLGCGAGAYAVAALTALFAVITLWLVAVLERRFNLRDGHRASDSGPPPIRRPRRRRDAQGTGT
jgi:putative Mg2+ transporter-C (MgtC) family protein